MTTTSRLSAVRLTVLMCAAEALSMTGFACYTTLLPVLMKAWGLNNSEAGLIGGVFYAGYMMAATGFLALAHTLKKGDHIRVTLLVSSLEGGWKRGFEIWALFAASVLALLSAVYSGKLAWQSYAFHDISTSNDATPLWLPQLSMAVGTAVLAIAFIDEFVLELCGARVVIESDEASHNE